MKSLLKKISGICLVILLPALAAGNDSRIRLSFQEQDTTGFKSKIRVDSFPLVIVPPASGVQFFRDKIIFLSLTKNERKMSSEHISFGSVEAYYASISDSNTGKHYLFSRSNPFLFPAEAVTFNHTFDTVYFTNLADNEREKIYMAKYIMDESPDAGISGEIVPLDFCTGNYSYSHPSLSADGKIMIFASDMEVTVGGMDLFISRKTHNSWSSPENLGNLINTARNEFFPFLDAENNLFFSSDGLKGYGGFDIFRSKYNGKGWEKPVNLSDRINSSHDDIAFTISPIDKKTGFFTRKLEKNKMQLYKIRGNQEYSNLIAVFGGYSEPGNLTAVVSSEKKSKPAVSEPVTTIPEKPAEKQIVKTPEKPLEKPVEKIAEKIPEKEPENKPPVVNKPKPAPKAEADSVVVTIKTTVPIPANQVDVVIYRVQILASEKQKKEKEITLNGKTYKLYEYYYKGAYRYCIGEFSTLQPALEIKKQGRESIYPQSFIAVFRNNKRTLNLVNSFK